MNSLTRLGEERDRFEREQREVEDSFMAYQEVAEKELDDLRQRQEEALRRRKEKSQEFIGRLRRLRLQQEVLKKKAVAILKEGYELDQLEEQERLEEERRRVEAEQAQLASEMDAVMEASASLDWNAAGVDLSGGPLSPATLAALETVGQDSGDGTY
ncbi:hypothetical protein DL763_004896 [Monosporascus cannonballus]|nr:hypothetical protein DL763_004896 [Monosporascus cannonballus]